MRNDNFIHHDRAKARYDQAADKIGGQIKSREKISQNNNASKANEVELKTVKSAYKQLLSQSAHISLPLAKYQLYEKGEYGQQYVSTFSKGKSNMLPSTRN